MKPSPKGERRDREATMFLQASLRVGARVDGMEKVSEPLINVVKTNKPKALIGLSQKARGGDRCSLLHLSQTTLPPAKKRLLTHPMAHKGNVVSPASSLSGQRTVRQAYGVSGRGGWKKRRPLCNEADRD